MCASGSLTMLSAAQIQQFHSVGYLCLPRLIAPDLAIRIRDRFGGLFAGKFETGVYPDEWHWREGLSFPSAAREIVNGWKCDRLVASMALSEALGGLASQLMGWEQGARIAQDDVLWKPPGARGIGYHQDSAYISTQFLPYENNSVTVWIALDEATPENGAVEYALGSHKWRAQATETATDSSFHTDSDHRAAVHAAAKAVGIDSNNVQFEMPSVPLGGCLLHHGDTWHGSGPNRSPETHRRALAVHLLRRDVQFRGEPAPDYIYGRYALHGSTQVDETFFPVVYAPDGYRSPQLSTACSEDVSLLVGA